MCDTVGIRIPEGTSIAKCASVIRKLEPAMSIADINSRIKNNEYVLSCDYVDSDGVKKIIRCYEELFKLGIRPKLYELDDNECSLELLKNLDNMYDEISDEVDAEIELEERDSDGD
ncbi:MAG: hypothetical protein J6Y08_07975 [Clostridiales bacterium]|nr:hypothetical protein [Clostridiales bacterium]